MMRAAERSELEARLHVLWGLSEIKKVLDELNEKGAGGWKGTDEDEEEIAWVQVYSRRQIMKIGERLRELDAEDVAEEAQKDAQQKS